MEQLFAYGTLKDKDIQETIFGRILKGVPETLVGYVVNVIHIEEEFGVEQYPIITPTENQQDTINGILYELTEEQLQQADTYEGIHYKRIQVQLQSNQTAWVYSATT
ncbi:gamma-glutamylcyclotransferase family protein [Flavobacterium gawalongense]|uniref:Gamma-glutamylcyclotransferase n=1 Tax=Flavobacterium gawalongense TaxID=2594432 RepID=A0ABY3CFL4_9FLAO|nr:gamma-glutamylcyclotransferase family protein [Flavobacterium gawalongense]TRW97965.1 gamma-glutamylcyclotransferase [Flavobacterium gawalongense]TRX02341.1 gamma-glutamylcyclotransferase [Flavobacterium gawalongense]